MTRKPTYEELEQIVKELKKEVVERTRAEEELQAILDVVPVIIFQKDRDGKAIRTSKIFNDILGLSKEEVVGKTTAELLPEHGKDMMKDDQEVMESGKPKLDIIEQYDTPEGARWARTGKVPLKDKEGNVVGLIGYAADITELKRAEELLKESGDAYKATFETTGTAMLIGEEDTTISMINEEFEKLCGYSKEEVEGKKSWIEFIVKSDLERMKGYHNLRMTDPEAAPPYYEFQSIDKQGNVRDCLTTLALIPGTKKTVRSIIDITDRVHAEEALKESEAQKRAILDASINRIRLVDKDMRIIWANKTTTREVNISPEDIAGEFCYRLFVGRDTPCPGCPTKKALDSANIEHDVMHQPKSKGIEGETYWDSYAVPMKDESGDIVNIIQIVRNITETKRAEETLRKYEHIISAAQEHMSLLDSNYIYQAVNDAYLKAHSKKRDEIVGHSVSELLGQQVFNKLVKNKLDRCLAGEDIHYQSWFDFPGLGRRYMDVAYYPFFEEDRSVSGVVVASRDITETKRLEDQFQASQRMEAIGTLAGGIAHNFNNVLMGIQGNTSLILLDKTSDHPDYERLNNIEQGVLSGAELTKQLLGFARGGKYEVKPTDLNELIKSQNRMFGRTKKEITIRGKYQEDPWTVEVDQGQINQVILNLYVNAWQAMPGGGDLYVQTENITLDEGYTKPFNVTPGRYVKISITDTGVGMDEATQQKIFDPFFTTQEMGRGTGLGLASAYGIIKNHGGIINVYSEKGEARPPRLSPAERDDGGQGSTFTIYLPASKKEIVKEEKIPEKVLKGTETVLLVDDEDTIIDVGEQLLKTLGYKVLVARGGKEAIEIYKKNKDKIDIVILDMIMPQMGGGEAYDRMKEINPDIKVLLSSGYSINGQATEILERGCNSFIQKPFNMKELSQSIREILDKK